jgi:hypothetical protein
MVSKVQRGNKSENECVELHKKLCPKCVIMKAQRTMKPIYIKGKQVFVSQSNDFFGLFDIIMLSPAKTKMFIQVKSNPSHVPEAYRNCLEFYNKYLNEDDAICVALRIPKKGWKMKAYSMEDGEVITYFKLNGERVDIL